MRKLARLFAPLVVLVAVGCASPSENKDDPTYTTIVWQLTKDGEQQFYTNDPAKFGSIYWSVTDNAYSKGSLAVRRVAGSVFYGSGLVFGWKDHNNFSYVLVDQAGYFTVGTRSSGEWETLVGWKESAALWTGLDYENIIAFVANGDGTYKITFNGDASSTFTVGSSTDPIAVGSVGPIGEIGPKASKQGSQYNEHLPVDARAALYNLTASGNQHGQFRAMDLSLTGEARFTLPRR